MLRGLALAGNMRNQVVRLATLIVSGAVAFSQGARHSDKGGKVQLELRETEPLTSGDTLLSPIRVELETEAKQPDVSAGLRFVTIFTNTGRGTVQMQDPDDAIQVELVDEKGWPVRHPTRPPAAFVNTSRGPGPRQNAPRVLNLQPGEPHRVTIQIREMQTEDSSRKAPLPRGKYTARVRALLLAVDPALARERSYRKLESERVTIEFGL
jgi:hypothetical protein